MLTVSPDRSAQRLAPRSVEERLVVGLELGRPQAIPRLGIVGTGLGGGVQRGKGSRNGRESEPAQQLAGCRRVVEHPLALHDQDPLAAHGVEPARELPGIASTRPVGIPAVCVGCARPGALPPRSLRAGTPRARGRGRTSRSRDPAGARTGSARGPAPPARGAAPRTGCPRGGRGPPGPGRAGGTACTARPRRAGGSRG